MTTYNNYYLGNKKESLDYKTAKIAKMAKISDNGEMDKNEFK